MSETMLLVVVVVSLFGALGYGWMSDYYRSEERRAMAVPGDDEGIDPLDLRQPNASGWWPFAGSSEIQTQRPLPQGIEHLGQA